MLTLIALAAAVCGCRQLACPGADAEPAGPSVRRRGFGMVDQLGGNLLWHPDAIPGSVQAQDDQAGRAFPMTRTRRPR